MTESCTDTTPNQCFIICTHLVLGKPVHKNCDKFFGKLLNGGRSHPIPKNVADLLVYFLCLLSLFWGYFGKFRIFRENICKILLKKNRHNFHFQHPAKPHFTNANLSRLHISSNDPINVNLKRFNFKSLDLIYFGHWTGQRNSEKLSELSSCV